MTRSLFLVSDGARSVSREAGQRETSQSARGKAPRAALISAHLKVGGSSIRALAHLVLHPLGRWQRSTTTFIWPTLLRASSWKSRWREPSLLLSPPPLTLFLDL